MPTAAAACARNRWRRYSWTWTSSKRTVDRKSPTTTRTPRQSSKCSSVVRTSGTLRVDRGCPSSLPDVFRWYNTVHRHSGIAMMTPYIRAPSTRPATDRGARSDPNGRLRSSSPALHRPTGRRPSSRLDQSTRRGNRKPRNHHPRSSKYFVLRVSKSVTCSAAACQKTTIVKQRWRRLQLEVSKIQCLPCPSTGPDSFAMVPSAKPDSKSNSPNCKIPAAAARITGERSR
jgi:hypothetical protein